MAKVKFGGGVSEIRGAIAGTVFSRNASGAYMRNRVKGTVSNSPAVTAQRQLFTALVSGWRDLTDEERNSWREGAQAFTTSDAVGERVVYTPNQLYMKLNGNLLAAGLPTNAVCPRAVAFPNIVPSLDPSVSSLAVLLDSVPGADFVTTVEGAAPTSQGVMSSNSKPFKKLLTETGASDTIAINGAYGTVYGGALVGDKVFVRVFLISRESGEKVKLGDLNSIVVV